MLALVSCVRLVHRVAGPVIVPMPEPLKPPTQPIATSDACVVVAVAVEDQDVLPASLTCEAVLSVTDEVTSPDHSMTVMQTEVAAGENETATAVWPPAQFGSAHTCVVRLSVLTLPAVSTWAKFPAAPPRVTPVIDGLVGLELLVKQTIRQLPAVVAEPSVAVSGELAPPVADTDWTSDGATRGQACQPVTVNAEQDTVAPDTMAVVDRLRSKPDGEPHVPVITIDPPDSLSAK